MCAEETRENRMGQPHVGGQRSCGRLGMSMVMSMVMIMMMSMVMSMEA